MNITKENALHEILEQFNQMVESVQNQLDLLEKIIHIGGTAIPEMLLFEVDSNELKIDVFERDISEKIIDMIVLQSPVASDLRKIMAIYQMVSNLERIGDQIKNVVKLLPRIDDVEVYAYMSNIILSMVMSSNIMVRKAVSSFINNDNESAIWTIKNDDVIDEINHKLIKDTIMKNKYSEKTQHLLFTFINLNSIISNIERIADHATNIAEASIYSIKGDDLRHLKHNEKSQNKGVPE